MSNSKDVFRFIVSTDNHMGFKHTDHIRGEDSFLAFSEALEIARQKDVDFILLGGDLFHTSRPSASVEHKCIQIIRQHMTSKCDRQTSFKRVAGKFSHFEKVSHPNFEDPHLTVPYPIMTIHGNHDDLTGPFNQSVCVKLATSGLLNYFGLHNNSVTKYTVEPIILQKGEIKIALYGMGFIPDFKLKAAFEKNEVTFLPPPNDTYNILVVHQNRVPHNEDRCITDKMYPDFIHLLIRGHEHDTQSPQILPESTVDGLVYQPGSTVATSIATGESRLKQVGIFEIQLTNPNADAANRFKVDHELVKLKSCRRMLFKDITQKEIFKYIKQTCGANKLTPAEYKAYSKEFVKQNIKTLLGEYHSSDDGSPALKRLKKEQLVLPLIRVRLEYVSKSERFDELEIRGEFYPDSVANPDIVMFKRQKLVEGEDGQVTNTTFATDSQDPDGEDIDEFDFVDITSEKKDTIESALVNYFDDKLESEKLKVLSINEYIDAIRGSFEDGNIISKVVKTKKQEVLHMYYAELKNEDTAKFNFHNIEAVEKWMISAFSNNAPKMGGDEDDVMILE